MSQKRINETRIYEGEWWFYCQGGCEQGYAVHYCLNEYENHADSFLSRYATGRISCAKCEAGWLEWAGYAGGSPISNSLVRLLRDSHYMASTVILSAVVESSIQNLLWAALVDSGIDSAQANSITDGRLNRLAMVDLIQKLTELPIQDISFPVRNLVAHGKGFLTDESIYKEKLAEQFGAIEKWVARLRADRVLPNFMPTECERWLLFMEHWTSWCNDYVVGDILSGGTDCHEVR